MLEYTGRGKSIIDVGLAQARYPLDTTNHYFEIEITDPGENCYIAIGLAKRVGRFLHYSFENRPGKTGELFFKIVTGFTQDTKIVYTGTSLNSLYLL